MIHWHNLIFKIKFYSSTYCMCRQSYSYLYFSSWSSLGRRSQFDQTIKKIKKKNIYSFPFFFYVKIQKKYFSNLYLVLFNFSCNKTKKTQNYVYHKTLFLTEKGKGRKHFVLNQNFQGGRHLCDSYSFLLVWFVRNKQKLTLHIIVSNLSYYILF